MEPLLPKVVLFDLDDTLVSFSANGDFWAGAFAARGHGLVPIEAEAFLSAIGRVSPVFWSDANRAAQGRLDLVSARREVARLAFAELGLSALEVAHAVADEYTWRKEDAVAPFAGAVETLHELRARGVRLGLITNGHGEFQRRKLTRHRLEPLFEAILIEGEWGVGKPHPTIFREALRRMSVEPNQAVMVGDNLDADIAGAHACGIDAIWHDYARVGLPPTAERLPKRIIHHVAELLRSPEP